MDYNISQIQLDTGSFFLLFNMVILLVSALYISTISFQYCDVTICVFISFKLLTPKYEYKRTKVMQRLMYIIQVRSIKIFAFSVIKLELYKVLIKLIIQVVVPSQRVVIQLKSKLSTRTIFQNVVSPPPPLIGLLKNSGGGHQQKVRSLIFLQ